VTALVGARDGIELTDHMEHEDAAVVFQHACKPGFEGTISKRKNSPYRSGRSPDWIKSKNSEIAGSEAGGRGLALKAQLRFIRTLEHHSCRIVCASTKSRYGVRKWLLSAS
jgi:hypothetical protein